MIRTSYDPTSGMIRADLAPGVRPAEVHAGHEGHAIVLHLTHAEAVSLMHHLVQAIRRAEMAKPAEKRAGDEPVPALPAQSGYPHPWSPSPA